MKILLLLFSMLLIMLKHPLSMGLNLLTQTILISMMLGLMNINFWYSYILMLIMVGGMLILFIYMTSVASNEKFKYNNKVLIMMISILLISMILLINIDYMNLNIKNYTMDFSNYPNLSNFYMSMTKFYNYPSNMLFILIFIHLLISLIAVVKISKTNQGPLRQMF
uniref:NADH-ubiquinone oxidoreductase chain 6 n=1 Tax=Latridiidae sp. 1 KM-2017 TaxID=2219441 RepID=A0A346RKG1_9CUCU|nr:NADH dehydrogenase subunit 6 [Latridiidae sp. 1 KM-2017]